MKGIVITIGFIFCFASSFAQTPVARSSNAVTAVDQHVQFAQSMSIPAPYDTTAINGLDSVGSMIYSRRYAGVYIRDTFPGGKKWTRMLKSGDAGTGVTTFNGRSGTVTLQQSDVTTALGFLPPNPNGTNLQYIAGDGSKVTFPTIPAQFNPIQGYGILITGSYPNKTFVADTGTLFPAVRATISGGGGGGIGSLNGLTAATQTFATGTTGTDFGISSSGTTHTFNFPVVSGTNTGKVTPTLFNTWNGKQNAITLTTIGSSGAATFISGTLNIPQYSGSGGTVTQVNSGLGLSGGPITSTGTLVFDTTYGGTLGGVHTRNYNDTRYLQNITGLITQSTNISISGLGTLVSPYSIKAGGNADSIKKLPVDTSTNRNNYVLTFDSLNHKWILTPPGSGGGGSGTVSQVNTGVGLTGGPVTTTGTIKLDTLYSDNRIKKIYNVKTYGAKGDGLEYYDGSISSGGHGLVSNQATFVSGDVGKVVFIDTAGGSGLPLVTTISAFTDAHHITITTAATTTVSNMRFVYGTDDNAAIQLAILACYAGGGGTVWGPNGLYILNGALQTSIGGANPNSQLYIPATTKSQDSLRTEIIIEGETGPNYVANQPFNNHTYYPSKKGTVFLSTINGSGTAASILSSISSNAGFANFSYNDVVVKNCTWLSVINWGNGPTVGGINCGKCATFNYDNVMVSVDGLCFNEPLPTADIAGIIEPQVGDEQMSQGRHSMVIGYRYGIVHGEHNSSDQVIANICFAAHVYTKNNAADYGGRIESQWSKYDVYIPATTILGITPDSVFLNISQLETEVITPDFVTGWYNNTNTIWDSLNYSAGSVYYHVSHSAHLYSDNSLFSTNGAANLITNPIEMPDRILKSISETIINPNESAPALIINDAAVNPVVITSSNTSSTRYYAQNTSTTGQAGFFAENNRGSAAAYEYLSIGSSAEVGTLFGVNRADAGFLFFDGPNLNAGGIGTITAVPFVLGTNNTSAIRIDGSQNVCIGCATNSQFVDVEKSTNANVWLELTNSTAGASSSIGVRFRSDGSNIGQLSKYSSTTSPYGFFTPGTLGFYTNDPAGAAYMVDANGSQRWGNNGNTEQMRLNANGELQIGSTTDQGAFTLQNTGGFYQNGTVALNLGSDATGDMYYRNSSGNLTRIGIGTGKQHLLGGTIPHWGDTATSGGGTPDTLHVLAVGSGKQIGYTNGSDSLFLKSVKADNGLTISTDNDSTNHIILGGDLTQNTSITGATGAYLLALGTSLNKLSSFQIVSAGAISLNGRMNYTSYLATDANYSVPTTATYVILPVITSGRTVTLSSIGSGDFLFVINKNNSGSAWTFGGTAVKDAAGSSITTLTNGTAYQLIYDGTNFIVVSAYP